MIHALKPLKPKPAKESLTSAKDNPAVARCSEVWDRAFATMSRRKGYQEEDAIVEADQAYCKAMPPLVGFENICDFIACVGYGMLIKVFVEGHGTKLLYAAQVALSTIPPQERRRKVTPEIATPLPPPPA
jgi:hypothetical protein